jgi:hypothetical protein
MELCLRRASALKERLQAWRCLSWYIGKGPWSKFPKMWVPGKLSFLRKPCWVKGAHPSGNGYFTGNNAINSKWNCALGELPPQRKAQGLALPALEYWGGPLVEISKNVGSRQIVISQEHLLGNGGPPLRKWIYYR